MVTVAGGSVSVPVSSTGGEIDGAVELARAGP